MQKMKLWFSINVFPSSRRNRHRSAMENVLLKKKYKKVNKQLISHKKNIYSGQKYVKFPSISFMDFFLRHFQLIVLSEKVENMLSKLWWNWFISFHEFFFALATFLKIFWPNIILWIDCIIYKCKQIPEMETKKYLGFKLQSQAEFVSTLLEIFSINQRRQI